MNKQLPLVLLVLFSLLFNTVFVSADTTFKDQTLLLFINGEEQTISFDRPDYSFDAGKDQETVLVVPRSSEKQPEEKTDQSAPPAFEVRIGNTAADKTDLTAYPEIAAKLKDDNADAYSIDTSETGSKTVTVSAADGSDTVTVNINVSALSSDKAANDNDSDSDTEPGNTDDIVSDTDGTRSGTGTGNVAEDDQDMTTSLDAPYLRSAYGAEGCNRIFWSPVENATKYVIQRRSSASYTTIAEIESTNSIGEHKVYYNDPDVGPAAKYYYRVYAVDDNGTIDNTADDVTSDYSRELGAQCKLKTPVIKYIKDGKLYWHEVKYANSYRVYMRPSSTAKWNYVGTTGSTHLRIDYHSDYYYTVQAFRGDLKSGFDKTFTYRYHNYSKPRVLIEGDSIFSRSGSWINRSSDMLGYTYVNKAVGGSCIADNPQDIEYAEAEKRSVKSVYYRVSHNEDYFKNYDVIYLEAGTNDYYYNVPLGDLASNDPETYFGAYNYILSTIKEQSPYAKIVLCTPLERYDGAKLIRYYDKPNRNGDTLADFRKAVFTIADEYGCQVYDLYSNGVVTADNIVTATMDNTHPTAQSNNSISDNFISWIRKYILISDKQITVTDFKAKPSGKKKILLTWSKNKAASGYEIFKYNKKTKSFRHIAYTKKTSYKYKKCKKNKYYSFKVRAYYYDNGNRTYGPLTTAFGTGNYKKKYTVAKKLTISPGSVTLVNGRTGKLKAKIKKAKRKKKLVCTNVLWTSSDPSVVSVDTKGNITARKMGSAVVTCRAHNGVKASVIVRVKKNAARKAKEIPVFTFHRIVDDNIKKTKFPNDEWVDSRSNFEKQIKYIRDNGYRTISMDEYNKWHNGKIDLPENSVLLTTDDCYSETYYITYPIVKKYGLKMTAFIVTGRTPDVTEKNTYDNSPTHYMGMDAVEQIRKEYPDFEIQGHSDDLHHLENGEAAVFSRSIEECTEDLEKQKEKVGAEYMAFPYGYASRNMYMALRNSAMNLVFGFKHYDYSTQSDYKFSITRIKITSKTTWSQFLKWLNRF